MIRLLAPAATVFLLGLSGGPAPAANPPAKAPLPTVLLYPATAGDVAALVDLRTRLRLDGRVEVLTYDPESAAIQRASAEDAHPEWLVSAPATDAGRMVLARALGAAFYAVVSPGRATDSTHVELTETAPAARTFDWTGSNRQFGVRAIESQVADSIAHPASYAAVADASPPPAPAPAAAPPIIAAAPPIIAAAPSIIAAAPPVVIAAPLQPAPAPIALPPVVAPAPAVVAVVPPAAPIVIALPKSVPPVPSVPLPLIQSTPAPLKLPAQVASTVPAPSIPAAAPPAALVPLAAPPRVADVPLKLLPLTISVPPTISMPPIAPLPPAAIPPKKPAQIAMLPKPTLPLPLSPLPTPYRVPPPAPKRAASAVVKKTPPKAEDITAIQPLLAKGDAALDGGDAVSAIALYRQAINGAPLSVVPRLKLAQAYQKDGLNDRALDEARRALEIAPDSGAVQQFLSDLDQQTGTTSGTLIRDRAALDRSPSDPAAHAALADTLWNNGDLSGAEAEYKAAQALAPAGNHAADAQLAQLYAAEARYDDCLAALRTAGKGGYALAIQIVKNRAETLSSTLSASRDTFASGKSTREQFYDDAKKLSAEAQALAGFVAQVKPPAEYRLSHLHRMLSTNLLAQEAATLVTYIETGDSRQNDSISQLERAAATEMLTAQATEEKLGLWNEKPQKEKQLE